MCAMLRYLGSSLVTPMRVPPNVVYFADSPPTFCRTSLGIAEIATNSGG